MEFKELERDGDHFHYVSDFIGCPVDYFDFPSSVIAFGESLINSKLVVVDNNALFRSRGMQLSLIHYRCGGSRLVAILEWLTGKGYNIKSLNFVHKSFEALQQKTYGLEHYVTQSYFSQGAMMLDHSSKTRNTIQRALRRCSGDFDLDDDPSKDEVLSLFDAWIEFAKQRHFMVVKGHYLRYVERYYEFSDNVVMLGFRRKEDGVLFGIVGYELVGDQAQITLAKHRPGINGFAYHLWTESIREILNDGAIKIFCGTTANELKRRLGFTQVKSYKVG